MCVVSLMIDEKSRGEQKIAFRIEKVSQCWCVNTVQSVQCTELTSGRSQERASARCCWLGWHHYTPIIVYFFSDRPRISALTVYMRTILALDWPLLVYIACDILLGLFLYKYLFLKWQYSSIGLQIMTNFVKIGTKNLLNPGKLTYSFDWLLILDTFAHQSSSSSWNLKDCSRQKSGKPQAAGKVR
jgi:hypothetical protein